MTSLTLKTRDGLDLHWREWRVDHARGTVLIVHGHGEHIERYAHVVDYLNQQGWAVAGYDQRGHGRSPGLRGRLREQDDFLHDMAAAIDQARARLPGGPFVIVGHSMGGVTSARFALGQMGAETGPWVRKVDAYVFSSPAFDVAPSFAQRLLVSVGMRLAPELGGSNGLKADWVSRDPAVVAKYKADPLVHGTIAPRLATFMMDSGRLVLEHAPKWSVPTLLLYAGSDLCVSPGGSDRFAEVAPKKWVTSRAFPTLYHEIFNEPEQLEVLDDMGNWLNQKFPRAAAA